jgi:hypothetical protein
MSEQSEKFHHAAARTERARRAGIGGKSAAPCKLGASTPGGRGLIGVIAQVWRRSELGTNHIASYGVWRRHTRRQAPRRNRASETRWHRPFREAAFALVGQAKREFL